MCGTVVTCRITRLPIGMGFGLPIAGIVISNLVKNLVINLVKNVVINLVKKPTISGGWGP